MSARDLVTIRNGALEARINPLGAELWSLTDAHGREFMTSADPAFWTGHAPLLFPIVGALNGGEYRLDGRRYALPKHGFARTSRFELEEMGRSNVRLRLRDNSETRSAYPFAFILDAEFLLTGNVLGMTVTVENSGTAPLPFSFGFHPAFAWPLPGGGEKDGHRIVFEREEPVPIRCIDPASGMLLPEPQATPVAGNVLIPDARMFERDALVWDRLASRSLVFTGEQGPSLEIAFPDTPYLGIWQKVGAPFLAIEPWHGLNDPSDFTGDLRDKPGIVQLAPGDRRSFRMDVTVRPG